MSQISFYFHYSFIIFRIYAFHCSKRIKCSLNFLLPISLQPDVVNLWYFKHWMFDLTEFIVWNISDLPRWVEKIKGLENQSFWQGLNCVHIYNYFLRSAWFLKIWIGLELPCPILSPYLPILNVKKRLIS